MQKYTQKQLKNLVATSIAVDITNISTLQDVPEPLHQVGYASGIYGCNGMLLRGIESGKLYAITARTTAIFLF